MATLIPVDSALGRVVGQVATHPRFRTIGPKVAPQLDRVLARVTGGRFLLSQMLVPTLVLTTTGARSGLQRTTPLATLPERGGSFLVVGSNFGREKHPGWTANLLANPRAQVGYRGLQTDVVAHLLDAEERAAVWPRLIAMWPSYDAYTASSGRELRVFRLTPVQA